MERYERRLWFAKPKDAISIDRDGNVSGLLGGEVVSEDDFVGHNCDHDVYVCWYCKTSGTEERGDFVHSRRCRVRKAIPGSNLYEQGASR